MNPPPVLKSPADCTEAEITAFETVLHGSGEPVSPTLAERIRRAECLAFARDAADQLRGVGALKQPKPDHCSGVFKRAAAQASPGRFSLELGWLAGDGAVTPSMVGALAIHAGARAVFSIVRADDTALQTVLEAQGFHADGAPWPSPRGAYSNRLYVREP